MHKASNEKGASMIEILGVLAVVATVATGMFSGIARINQKIKLTRAQTEVSDIVKAMRSQFSSFVPASVTPKKLYEIGIFKNYTEGGTPPTVSVFGKEMTISITSGADNPYFTFSYKDIPTSVCPDLLLGDWGNDPSSGLREIEVKGTSKTSVFQWARDIRPADPEDTEAPTTRPLLPELADAINACSVSDGVGSVTISWKYYL